MAGSCLSLLLQRRHYNLSSLTTLTRRYCQQSNTDHPNPNPNPKPTSSLSARLSLVFDKIDGIEKEKDDALQRIRAWRESKKKKNVEREEEKEEKEKEKEKEDSEKVGLMNREIEMAHPWNEWVSFMERLMEHNYFDYRRKDEDKMVECLGVGGSIEEQGFGFDFTRDWKTVNAAVVNFGKDRFDILRSVWRQDIQTLVGYGCPSADKKLVFSSKLLRKLVHLDEGDVCSCCSLRNNCERAYLVTNKEDEARTIDLMRVLLIYGFDPINGSVENKSLLKHKSVKTVVRKLLHQVVRLSAVPIDPNLPPPVIKKRPPKVKQPPPPPKRRVGRDDIDMKKGDWLCPKCNFMNFAKNSVCLQCDAKRPKRQLLPGEWECPQCNFLNYRRNMSCFNCEHKRPPDEYIEEQMQGRQQRRVTKLERAPNRDQVSNACNFDFDDDESDGADVAAFEYADAHVMNEDDHLYRPQEVRTSRVEGRESQRPMQAKHNMGFDDFDDDDGIDSYEVDSQSRSDRQEAYIRFSDVETGSYSDVEEDDLPEYSKSSKSLLQKGSLTNSGDDNDMDIDSYNDLPVHPRWKSSHVADSGRMNKDSRGSSKRMSFGSDDDGLAFGSGDDSAEDLKPRHYKNSYYDVDGSGIRRGEKSNHNRKQSGIEGHKRGRFLKASDSDDEFGRSHRSSWGNQRGSFSNARGSARGDLRVSFDISHGRQTRSDNTRSSQRGAQTYSGPRQARAGGGQGRRSNGSDYNWSEQDRPLRQRRNLDR